MMTIPLDQIANMPAFSPYYPEPPARYRNVQFQYVHFRADVPAVERVLPACFEPAPDGYCVAFGLTAGWTSNYGSFQESGLIVKCTYNGQPGYFAPVVFLNSRSSIPAGREIYGTPKVYADLQVELDERVMHTETQLAGTSVLSVRSTMHSVTSMDSLPDLSPSWRLKVIPRADGRGADVMQLIDAGQVSQDVEVHVCCRGDGVVEFGSVPIYDLTGFAPREYFGAYYLEMDFTEGYAEIVKDLLRDN